MTLPPSLLIVGIDVRGKEVSADIQIGTRQERIVIDLSIPDFVEYKEIPRPLEGAFQAKRTLIDVLLRRYRGESVELPLDLSSATRDVSEGWPLRLEPEGHEVEQPVDIRLTKASHNDPQQGMSTVQLQVLGVPTVVVVDYHDDAKATRFRFVSGVHPWQLTDAEAWSMLLALSDATVT